MVFTAWQAEALPCNTAVLQLVWFVVTCLIKDLDGCFDPSSTALTKHSLAYSNGARISCVLALVGGEAAKRPIVVCTVLRYIAKIPSRPKFNKNRLFEEQSVMQQITSWQFLNEFLCSHIHNSTIVLSTGSILTSHMPHPPF